MEHRTELLAPAGSLEALRAAVECGADAVYLGATNFNARLKSENFNHDDFERAIDYAHSKDVFVYLALNTLVRDDELNLALETARQAANFGVDAFIVQDLGLISLLKANFPDVAIHASTQLSINDSFGVNYASEIGAQRVVLARELSLDEIRKISKETKTELEVFVHGAICICYSGQCLMSSMLGGRSGNRGQCAQPCRLPYTLFVNGESKSRNHLLSPKDLCGIEEIPKLVEIGVKSIKIEGRLKTPEYVAAVTTIYRKYLDFALEGVSRFNVANEDMETLMQVFNRGGFSSGWLNAGTKKNLMSVEKPKNWGLPLGQTVKHSDASQLAQVLLSRSVEIGDGVKIWNGEEVSPGAVVSILKKGGEHVKVTSPDELVSIGVIKGRFGAGCKVYQTSSKRLREFLSRKVAESPRKVEVSATIDCSLGEKTVLKIFDAKGNEVKVVSELMGESSRKVVLTSERISEQLRKTRDSEFVLEKIEVNLEGGVYFPLSEIGSLRRLALEQLHELRRLQYKRDYPICETTFPRMEDVNEKKVSVLLHKNRMDYLAKNKDIDIVYLPIDAFDDFEMLVDDGFEVFAWLPAGIKESLRDQVDQMVEQAVSKGIAGLLLGGIGDMRYIDRYPALKFRFNHGFNMYNSKSIKEFSDVTVSPELETEQIAKLTGEHLEAQVYGYLTAMTSAQCFFDFQKCSKDSLICPAQEKSVEIEDARGRKFRMLKSPTDCGTIILASNKLDIINEVSKMKNIMYFRIEMCDESEAEIKEVISRLKSQTTKVKI